MATTVVAGERKSVAVDKGSDSWSLQRHHRRMQVLRRISIYALVLCGVFLFAFPLYWMVITSLAPEKDVLAFPPKLIPTTFDWQNYTKALSTFPFVRGLTNTLI